ncbi:N-acetyltransferase [Flammeovirga pectinis]|uniref:N-acetyltransferase n=1 Tax=Flammeovirga pectinis TaxID=2494373 RepID=A0A3S9P9E1_9BACT|nr:GNAT family N-acetyltransferase [Flammeovirga pectinis]AZQ64784.1 N-acetyltransferase [Flammeovirga pectinis]
MITLKRTNSTDIDFQNLVLQLDKDLAIRNGDTNDFFAKYNTTDQIKNVIVAYYNDIPVGCGAMKEYALSVMEMKRMYVVPEMRGKKVAVLLFDDLENWAEELGYKKCILETGDKMPEAIGLYKKRMYKVISNYGQYEEVESSICFEKIL